MIVCGKCPHSNVDSQKAKKAFRSSISTLAEKIDRYDEWGLNPEVTQEHRLKTKRIYRKREEEKIKGQVHDRKTNKRIEQLKKQIGGPKNENTK